jgi:hypothetical protein
MARRRRFDPLRGKPTDQAFPKAPAWQSAKAASPVRRVEVTPELAARYGAVPAPDRAPGAPATGAHVAGGHVECDANGKPYTNDGPRWERHRSGNGPWSPWAPY